MSRFLSIIGTGLIVPLMWFTVTTDDSGKYCKTDVYSVTRQNSQGQNVEIKFNANHAGKSGESLCTLMKGFPRS